MKTFHNNCELGFGALETICEAYFAAPEKDATEAERLCKSLAQCQLELWGLASRRLQACLSLPRTLARCKTPLDVVQTQVEFWETAFLQGAESTRRVADGVGAAAGMPNPKLTETRPKKPARDFIALPVRTTDRIRDGRGPIRSSDQRRVA